MLFSLTSFRTPVSHQIQRHSPLVSARYAGDTALRFVAQQWS
jgi:hypothetical protein